MTYRTTSVTVISRRLRALSQKLSLLLPTLVIAVNLRQRNLKPPAAAAQLNIAQISSDQAIILTPKSEILPKIVQSLQYHRCCGSAVATAFIQIWNLMNNLLNDFLV